MIKSLILTLTAFFVLQTAGAQAFKYKDPYPFHNLAYVVYRAPGAVAIDGNIDAPEWAAAQWTEDFRDIQGVLRQVPPAFRTRAKMMWDDEYLYVAAEMEEPHLWANLKYRDAVIYYDNDIEMFIDVSGTGHNYYEFEFNALGTEWDLLLSKPYVRGGTFFSGWDIHGMKSAVKCYGTLNDPGDKDAKWTFEMALPLSELVAVQYGKMEVQPGEQWRVNFSRVQWPQYEIKEGKYKKLAGKEGFGNEENWVWCPTGVIDMHRPEHWGFMQFSAIKAGQGSEPFNWDNGHQARELLWTAADRIAQFRGAHKGVMPTAAQLDLPAVEYVYSPSGYYTLFTKHGDRTYSLSMDGELTVR